MALQRLNIEQKRAKAAFEYAEAATNSKNYSSYAKKMPMHILNNGLANALAFAYSKSDWQPLYKDVEKWLKEDEPQNLIKDKFVNNKSLMQVIVELNDSELRQVTNEVLALFSWLRRFVKED